MGMGRAAASASISFALINVPVKLYLTASAEDYKFNMITPAGHKVKQQLLDSETNEEVERETCSSGYEVEKGNFVIFSDEELDALAEGKSNLIEISEFVDDGVFDPRAVEKSYYLLPDKSTSEKSYRLLVSAMKETKKMAVAKWFSRKKDHLTTVRVVGNFLVMFKMFYANELRGCDYEFSNKTLPKENEVKLASKLIKQLSSHEFNIKNYIDEYAERVAKAIELKKTGQEIKILPGPSATKEIDLVAMLEASLKEEEEKAKVGG